MLLDEVRTQELAGSNRKHRGKKKIPCVVQQTVPSIARVVSAWMLLGISLHC